MKKNVLMAAFVAVLAFGLFSCTGEVKTKTQYLTIDQGWQLSEGYIDPAYQFADGSQTSNLMDYLYSCEKDDHIIFAEGGAQTIITNDQCAEGLQGAEVAALWHFDNELEPTVLHMQLPFFYNAELNSYDEELENCTILQLDDTMLKIKYTFQLDEEKYTFTMTYLPANKVS